MNPAADVVCSVAAMRCFIAISIPDAIKTRIGEIQEQLQRMGSGVRWVPPISQHITLKFLGEIAPSMIPRVADAASSIARSTPKMEIGIGRLGAFPSLNRPRVFWAGISEEGGALATLAVQLEEKLAQLGFEPEERSWNPHITLGRVKNAFTLKALVDYIKIETTPFDAGSFIAADMILFQSVLRPEGALYTPLKRFDFEGKPGPHADS